ncbi:MAG: hypothetical protein AUH42_06160 [Gemmatimonadetes bacterium 13_1_40CM_70_11]|nr:MAG: hypothetical protein AUH42_06160 [Gemmatimonadetes bacterium 13_1_40CM_70_11]
MFVATATAPHAIASYRTRDMPSVSWREPLTSTSAACIHCSMLGWWGITRTCAATRPAAARSAISSTIAAGDAVPTTRSSGIRSSGSAARSSPRASTTSSTPLACVTCPAKSTMQRSRGRPNLARTPSRSSAGRKRCRSTPPRMARNLADTRAEWEKRRRTSAESPIIPSARRSSSGSRRSGPVHRTNHTSLAGVRSAASPQVSASRGASGAITSTRSARIRARMRRVDAQTRPRVRGLMG